MIPEICGGAVGVVFLLTALVKSLDVTPFARQLAEYGFARIARSRVVPLLFVGYEWLLGSALLLRLTDALIPVGLLTIVVFIAITAWGTLTHRVEDCGCYGGFLQLTPVQSILLDCVYASLLAVAWTGRAPVEQWLPAWWQLAIVLAVTIAGTAMAARSILTPIYKFTLLGKGKRWKQGWLKESPRDVSQGSHFVVFLSQTCPHCKRWVPLMNVIEVQPQFPQVMGIMSVKGDDKEAFQREHLIHFPITYMPKSRVAFFTNAFPTAALIQEGKIVEKWEGQFPESYLASVRNFLDAISVPETKPARFGG